MTKKIGQLTVIYGSMFSGKTSYLINKCINGEKVLAVKPRLDKRYSTKPALISHNRVEVPAILVETNNPNQILKELNKTKNKLVTRVIIDEVNFFNDELVEVVKQIVTQGLEVVAAGLLLDADKKDFGPTRKLIKMADIKEPLYSRCDFPGCINPAEFSYAKVAKKTQVLVGAADLYGACCKKHYGNLHAVNRAKGVLISFEGGEGGGKTVQTQRLVKKLTNKGYRVMSLREPGGTIISEQIRSILLNPSNTMININTEVLLFQAARAQIYHELVIPALEAGNIVIMDRTRDSSVVYQGIVQEIGIDFIDQLNNFSTKRIFPNLTILLDVPVEVGLKRRAEMGGMNRMDLLNHGFHEKVRGAYLNLAKGNSLNRWCVIDATKSIKEVERKIWKVVEERLKS